MLLSKGADPNKAAIDADGDMATPLYWAAQHESTEVVRSLLASGADPNKGYNSTDEDGDVDVITPLYKAVEIAADSRDTDVVKSLLASGARQDLDTGGGELG